MWLMSNDARWTRGCRIHDTANFAPRSDFAASLTHMGSVSSSPYAHTASAVCATCASFLNHSLQTTADHCRYIGQCVGGANARSPRVSSHPIVKCYSISNWDIPSRARRFWSHPDENVATALTQAADEDADNGTRSRRIDAAATTRAGSRRSGVRREVRTKRTAARKRRLSLALLHHQLVARAGRGLQHLRRGRIDFDLLA